MDVPPPDLKAANILVELGEPILMLVDEEAEEEEYEAHQHQQHPYQLTAHLQGMIH